MRSHLSLVGGRQARRRGGGDRPPGPPIVAGRVPPHDLDAEAAVLSAILLSRDALDRVLDVLRPEHFYSDANGRIYEAAEELAVAGTPVDIVSVVSWLRDRERLAQVGGAAYLAQIADATPAVAHVTAHAQVVYEKWRVRQLIATCQRVAAEGYGDYGPLQEYIDGAEQAIYELARASQGTTTQPLAQVLKQAFEQVTAAASRGERITGIPTGFDRLDGKTAGLHDGDLTIVAARPGMGKCQPYSARVLTPSGWRTMGELSVGDTILGADGTPTTVVGVFEQGEKEVYRVTMDDGGSTMCSDDHLWMTRTRADRRATVPRQGSVKTTAQVRQTMDRSDGKGANHSVRFMAPAEFAFAGELPLDPWLLGAYLGDGCSSHGASFSNPEEDIRARISAALPPGDELVCINYKDMRVRRRERTDTKGRTAILPALEALGLKGCNSADKFIPVAYLRAPIRDRVALLQGICDTDGYVTDPQGCGVEYTTVSPRLRDDIAFLVGSLGGRATWQAKASHYVKNGERHPCREAYRMILSFPAGNVVPVSSAKHLAKYKLGKRRVTERFIQTIEPAGRAQCRCIAIDSEDQLYVTDDFIVTHNTSWVLNVAVSVASPRGDPATLLPGFGVAVFSLEMPREQLAVRMLCSEARIDLGRMRQGFMQPEDWRRATDAGSFLSTIPIWIDDTPALTVLELRARVRRIQAEYDRQTEGGQASRRVGLVVVDYLQLMKGREGVSSREQEISEISRGLKALAKELKVPVIALSQLNRAVETRSTKDKRPQLSDLRECIVGDALVPDAITGDLVRMREIAEGRPTVVYGLRSDGRVAAAPVAAAWSTGIKPVYRLRTASGRTLRCTANHPVRTYSGWTRADALEVGERIAVPRSVPTHALPVNSMSADELRLVGYLISDGHYGKHRTVGYVKADPALVEDVRRIALDRFGITAKPKPCDGVAEQIELTTTQGGPGCNPLIEWLKELGIHGQTGAQKRVPERIFRCSTDLLGIFLGALWAGDGCVMPRKKGGWALKFTNTSMGLLDDVQWILTRLGVVATRGRPRRNSKSTVDIATIVVAEADAILRFAEMVVIPGVKGEKLLRAVEFARQSRRNARLDRLPLRVTEEVASFARAAGMSWMSLGYRCQGKEMCRSDLAHVAKVLKRDELELLAESDILWDPVEAIDSDGEEETFDLRVPGLNNFIVGNIFAHNSGAIEQDADNIIFIYRDEYYNPETTNAKGLAELIIAKQRNGPTGKVLTRFAASCTRFDNLAPGDYPDINDE